MVIGEPAYAYLQQDHLAHIQGHLQFALNPIFGANPFVAPKYLPNAIEHIKQHMTLWYLNRMNGYVTNLRHGKPVSNYDDPKLTATIDQLYATVAQHVTMDSQQVFQQILPQLQQLQQIMQQTAVQPQLPPDAQVVKDTSMAETQRKAAKDKQDAQIAQAKMQSDTQRVQAEMAADASKAQMVNQTQLQIAQQDRDAHVAIENAKLTHEAIQQTQGVPNGNF
jgi:hypothetical protein